MTPRRLALAVVLVVVAASVSVGAANPSGAATDAAETPATPANATAPALGQNISMVMQASAAQAEGAVENGMWSAAFAHASNASEKRALVERRVGQLNGTIAELQAERRALRAAYRNGSINQTTYRVRLSRIVGRLAALGEGIEETSERGAAVGVNPSRLDELRTQARNLTGPEVSELARSLAGPPDSPGQSGVFGDGPPGQSDDRGPIGAGNASNKSASGPPGEAGNGTAGGQGPPSGDDRGTDDAATATPTATESSDG